MSSAAQLAALAEDVVQVDYRSATSKFCNLIVEGGHPLGVVVREAVSAAAPYIQVPSHLMIQPGGDVRGVNYDHTILGFRAAVALLPTLPESVQLLPSVQAMWYLPQGLDIWEQILCEFPGNYAVLANCNTRSPGPDDGVDRFDGPTWISPKVYFEDREPVLVGDPQERLERLMWAILEGDRALSYGLFLGLARDPQYRGVLKEHILRAGISDLQDTLVNRGGYQNLGHKALRARAMTPSRSPASSG